MTRFLTAILILNAFVCCTVTCPECGAGSRQFAHVWWAADSSWAVGGFGQSRPGLDQELLRKKPPGLDGLKAVELVLREPGEWFGFGVRLKKAEKVVFTQRTKFVLTDRAGGRVESVALVFYPDQLQTSIYDSRRMAVVVSNRSVWSNPANGYPSGLVKFPAGSIQLEGIVSFEVIGATADTLRRAVN